jgi:hypothetical protein
MDDFYMNMDKFSMDEKLKFDGMNFIHVITVVKKNPFTNNICGCWMPFANDPYNSLHIVHIPIM